MDLEELGILDRQVVAAHIACLDTGQPRLQPLSLGILRSPSQHVVVLTHFAGPVLRKPLRLLTNKEDEDDALLGMII